MAESPEQQQTDATQMPQWKTRYNPPGLSELVYRGGRYRRALTQMLSQLSAQSGRGRGEAAGLSPLAALNTEAQNDWTVALMHAWAAVTEVLGFYQERIINEGYLRTATERRSVLELARTIGYELPPGVAASAALAFTVLTTKDEPSRQVIVSAGTAVQSVPGPGERTQTFETSAEFVARSEWNALKPAHVRAADWPQYRRREAASARLIGTDTSLRPGDRILIVDGTPARDGGKRPCLLVTLKTAQPFPERRYTLVTWEKPSGPSESGLLHDPVAFVMRQQAGLFGYTPGGVLSRSKHDSGGGTETDWAPAAIGLPQTAVHALIGDAQGVLFAGTGQGLFRSADQGENWQPVSVGLVPKEIHALTLDREGRLLAGTDDGHIYLSRDGGEKWTALSGAEVVLPPRGLARLWSRGRGPLPKTVVRALAVCWHGRRRALVAATDEGVFRSRDRGKTWQPSNEDLPKTGPASVVAWTLAVTGRKKRAELYAGTDAGVFHIRERIRLWPLLVMSLVLLCSLLIAGYSPPPAPWMGLAIGVWLGVPLCAWLSVRLVRRRSQCAAVSLGKPVRALVAGKKGQLFAGTGQGLYRSDDGSAGGLLQRIGRRLARFLAGDLAWRWQQIDGGLANKDIRALVVDAQGDLLAGTGDGSVFRSRDDGDTWETLGTGLSIRPIQAVWVTKDRLLAAGLPSEGPVEGRWSPFQVEQRLIDLDQVYPDILPGSWVVLRDGQDSSAFVYQVTKVEVADSRNPAKPGRFSRITVDRSDGLDGFDRGTTLVLIQSEPLHLLADRPLDKDVLTLDGCVPGLERGHKLIVSGKRLRARVLSQAPERLKLVADDGLQSVDLDVEEAYPVLSVRDGGPPETREWRLKTRTGFVGSVTAAVEQILLEPAEDGDEIVSEVTEIKSVEAGPKQTEIALKSPLRNSFDGTTVTVYGNVVYATHGQTVEDELLGSRAGLAAGQHFLLKQRPLTYTSAATGRGVESTLKIEINGVSWQQMTSFDCLDRGRHAFAIRHDEQGNTAVLFGSGPQGTGIPSGAEQISATYRQGLGREGNVAAGSLHLLQTALPGVKAVTNPRAAAGGADPETMAEARWKAPLRVRAMERIVSFSDYEDFTRRFAGIGKAQARLICRNARQWLHITIADTAGNEVAEDSNLYKNLAQAIHSSRACPVPPLYIDSFKRIFFQLKAKVRIKPDHHARTAEIETAAKRALEDAFAFERREFGQPVAAAEVITLIQSIPGVLAVELEQLYQHGQEPKLNLLLEAKSARWDADQLRPAEMLVIQPIAGIELELETAR